MLRPWHKKNTVPFDPTDLKKGEGRGERKYSAELCLQGYDAKQNIPGQNPDVLVEDGLGREVKQLDDSYCFRVSAAFELQVYLAKNIIRPLEHWVKQVGSEDDENKMLVGSVKATTMRTLLSLSKTPVEPFFQMLFEHSNITHIVLCMEEGYIEFDLELFCECFEFYKIDSFTAKVRLKKDRRKDVLSVPVL